jgi:hypothetical protein
MKILYLSCHEILEFDELSMFVSLGIDVFSIGAYFVPDQPVGNMLRAPIRNLTTHRDDLAAYHAIATSGSDIRCCLTAEFMERFDAVIVMHIPEWVEACCNAAPRVPVIWRTIGQSTSNIERRMSKLLERGLRIVRYSPGERHLPDFAGEHAMIRFGKAAVDFDLWRGDTPRVVTFAQNMERRSHACRYDC